MAVLIAAAISVAFACRAEAAIFRINQDVTATISHVISGQIIAVDEDRAHSTTGMLLADPGTHNAGVVTAIADDGQGSTVGMTLSSGASFGPVNSFKMVGRHSSTLNSDTTARPTRTYNRETSLGVYGTSIEEKSQFVYRFELDRTTRLTAAAIVDRAEGTNFLSLFMQVDNSGFLAGHTRTEVLQRSIMDPLSSGRTLNSMDLAAGEHTLYITDSWTSLDGGGVLDSVFDYGVLFALGGGSELDPILPDGTLAPPWTFTNAFSGLWFDPELTGGYTFQMQSESLFTSIRALPSFLTDPVTISANGVVLGQYGAGQSVDFTGLAGGAVSNFSITGITPGVDGDDPRAFPIQLAFSTPLADFSMAPIADSAAVPEPVSLLAWSGIGLLGTAFGWTRRRRNLLGA